MLLPNLPMRTRILNRKIVAMRGINLSDSYTDGDLAEGLNLSAKRYPYISTRNRRTRLTEYENVTAMAYWGKLVAVMGTNLYYDGNVVGTVTEGAKQFAVVNTKLIIWPDKKYLDLQTSELKDLGASVSISGSTSFTTNKLTVPTSEELTTHFKVGDCISISGCTNAANNKDVVIKALTVNTITVSDNAFTAASQNGGIKLERKIPDLDYICESENRLWGCSSSTQTIYASSLGDPTNFFVYEGISTDSYALAVGSEGEFTGCCKLASSILFWKETKLHKILGSFPAEYALYSYDYEGLRKGCSKSLTIINETLFYMGLQGVYVFTGGTPTLISPQFGNKRFTDAVGGSDGDSYYLSVTDGDAARLMTYESNYGFWVPEDNLRIIDFARAGNSLYMLDDSGNIWLTDSGEDDSNIEWLMLFKPFYEISGNDSGEISGRKTYSSIIIRVQLPKGSYIESFIRCDGGKWKSTGIIKGGTSDNEYIRIPINRCDRFEIKLTGKGPCTILQILRQFSVLGDK